MAQTAVTFEYDSIDESTSVIVKQRTSEIKSLMRKTAQGIVEIGHKLIEVKEELPYGKFEEWVNTEFGWSKKTAYNFINVAKRFDRVNFTQVDIATSALYMLSSPSTPDEAREEAIERAEQGESISHSDAKEITNRHKGRQNGSRSITQDESSDYSFEPEGIPDDISFDSCPFCNQDLPEEEEVLNKAFKEDPSVKDKAKELIVHIKIRSEYREMRKERDHGEAEQIKAELAQKYFNNPNRVGYIRDILYRKY